MRLPCAARALIPDDDDEELIEKAKANRKKRLASEKEIETEFKKSGGFAEGEVGRTLPAQAPPCAPAWQWAGSHQGRRSANPIAENRQL